MYINMDTTDSAYVLQRSVALYGTGSSHLRGCHNRKTVCTDSQSVWHWSQHTRCTDSYMRGVEGLWDPERQRWERGGWVLDKMAEVLKKKRKNRRDTVLRVALVRFPLLFTVLPLWSTVTSSLSIVSLFCYHFPRLRRTAFHFLIEKGKFAFK